ncbi:MAG: hypothetical protein NZ703_13865, partial [Gemmataceae bacterium]|nr:hypothetical protein [Gemmataceae bacterium]
YFPLLGEALSPPFYDGTADKNNPAGSPVQGFHSICTEVTLRTVNSAYEGEIPFPVGIGVLFAGHLCRRFPPVHCSYWVPPGITVPMVNASAWAGLGVCCG